MTNYKPIDSVKEDFRKYLEKAGVMDVLTKVLVNLYQEPEKPEDAIEYLRNFVVQKSPNSGELEAVKMELSELRGKYDELLEQYKELKQKVHSEEENLPAEVKEDEEMPSESAEAPATIPQDPQ